MAESEKSVMIEDEDLEDGEIESDGEAEDCVVVEVKPPPEPPKPAEKSSPHKKKSSPDSHRTSSKNKSSGSSSSRKEKQQNNDEDDFMSKIENALAENLKKSGIEPPMPSVKKHVEPDQESDRRTNRNSRKRRKRKERKDQKRESGSGQKRTKVNDNDGFYMVGGSPDHSGSESEDDTSYSSYDSEEYHRQSYEERRNKRRDKYGSNRERDRERERDRDRKDKKNRETEKEVCLRFSEFGHCPDDDCPRVHEVRQPKKMELCKFWLMECCAKKDKCSYMHGDFPCKYYYLGLKCVNKECKFMHGKPLSDNIKGILLKHLDTAPKEILGDFPRIGRENATKMMAQTHIKLCQEFNVPLPESEKDKNSSKIPSLLEMNIKPPDFKCDKKSSKSSNTRWLQNETKSPSRDSPQRSTPASGPGDVVLADLRGILSDKQVESMAAIGVITVNHINNLTVAQLNDLGLSLATIGEIQATAMNMDKKPEAKEEPATAPVADVDLRELPQALDVDMRVIPTADTVAAPLKSPDTIMSPNQSDADEIYKKPETPPARASSSNAIMSPPGSGFDYSQYLRDSNVNNDDEVEDEPGLKIDETYCTSDYEAEDKKDSQSEDDQQSQDESKPKFEIPLLPPSFDTNHFLKSTPVVTKIDISSSVSQLMEKEAPKKPIELVSSPSRDPRSRDPRMTSQKSPTAKQSPIPEIASPTYRDPRQKQEPLRRASIYEIESPSEDEDLIKIDRDKDMRLPPFLRDSENGDVDLRFPFTPMSNYVPATEIEGSFGTHIFEKYEVKVVDVPKPDYAEIRRSFRQTENTQDPRLKKLCGLQEVVEETATTTAKPGVANALPLDPRKRKQQEAEATGPKKLQITTILRNSNHYNDLSSSQKMVVNEVLAELTKELKLFHANPAPNKVFDTSFITQRPKLQQILIGLGVYVGADGEFEEIKDMPMITMPNVQLPPPPLIPNLPAPSLIQLNRPPPNFIPNMRPGLLGVAPSLPYGNNFDVPPDMNFSPMNQGMPFGEQQFNNNNNSRDFGGNQNNRRDQRQQNSGFRNNSNRNNNYSRHRRN